MKDEKKRDNMGDMLEATADEENEREAQPDWDELGRIEARGKSLANAKQLDEAALQELLAEAEEFVPEDKLYILRELEADLRALRT